MEHIKQIITDRKITASNGNTIPGEEEKRLKLLFMRIANEYIQKSDPGDKFKIDVRNKEIIQGLWCYFLGLQSFYDPNKGFGYMARREPENRFFYTYFRLS